MCFKMPSMLPLLSSPFCTFFYFPLFFSLTAVLHGEYSSCSNGLCTESFANFSTSIFDVPRSLQDQQLTKLLLGVGTNSRKRSYTTVSIGAAKVRDDPCHHPGLHT